MFACMFAGLPVLGAGTAAAEEARAYIEFLWSPTPGDALARQQTLGFVREGSQQHQVCVAALGRSTNDVKSLRIEVSDASGTLVSSQIHDDFRGSKRCYPADLPMAASPGEWVFKVYLDDVSAGSSSIEVANRLEDASFYQPSSTPYVLGRPNYDSSIPPEEFVGRLVWIMHVDEAGTVTGVEVEEAEGVGVQMMERAIEAGNISLFPPDPSRAQEPLKYRRELAFAPD